ncbi:MAG: nitrogen regulation protein NR(I) [Acidiferrobacteraceae bacterium]
MSKRREVWVVDDDQSIRWVLEKAFGQAGLPVRCFESAEPVLAMLEQERPDVLITDIRMPGPSGLELLERIQRLAADLPVIVITAHTDLESAVSAYRGGAFEYLPKPFDVDDIVRLARRAIDEQTRRDEGSDRGSPAQEIIGEAPAMQEVFRAIGRLSGSHVTVLISGESGTGKELVARALHTHSPRATRPFVAINTAAVPGELLESELFGHERGAFTGAVSQRKGRFEQAHGGTHFLDEIGDMPPALQTRLLRVLADGRFYRVGGHEQIESAVRIIAATNHDLEARVRDGGFREDLFHRLNVIRIHVPPLRERRDDIPQLARRFLRQTAEELKVETKDLLKETEEHLKTLSWPGNVRQLENMCRWLTVMAPSRQIRIEDLPPELRGAGSRNEADWRDLLREHIQRRLAAGESGILVAAAKEFERVALSTALEYTRGHKQDAARRLGWGRNTVTRKLRELDL